MSNETNIGNTQEANNTWADYAATAFAGGSGSESAPYLIANAAQLAFMAKIFNDDSGQYASTYNRKYYKLTGNIDLEKREWVPIGNNPFGRKVNTCLFFDGGNHTVSGLMISKPEESYSGLFGFADGDSSIKNLNIADGNVTGFQHVGGVIGRIKGSIENCTFTGQVTGTWEVGGIAGRMNYGSICNCTNSGTVTCDSYGGGIVGSLTGYMYNCSNRGRISGAAYIGGLAGVAKQEGCIESGENGGWIEGKDHVGGIVGQAGDTFSLTLCLNQANINGDIHVGGIAGQAPLVRYCCNQAEIRGIEILGGVCGKVQEVLSCQNSGAVKGTRTRIGGIAGVCFLARNSINLGSVSGHGPIGGIIGTCEGDLVKDCYNSGTISGTGIVGGVIGVTTQSKYEISNCYNAGNLPDTWACDPILGRHDVSHRDDAKIDTSYYLKGCVEANE